MMVCATITVILERHCTSMRSVATGNRFGNLFGLARAILEEIPECDYFAATLKRGRNISFEDDGLRREKRGENISFEDDG